METLPIAVRFMLTLAVGIAGGLVLKKLKVPSGLMIGALAGVAVLNCTTEDAWVPIELRIAVQIVSGAFIGSSLDRSDLARLRHIGGPVATMLAMYFVITLVAGIILHYLGGLDFATAFMSAVPGGVSDVPVVAADMGADAPTVALLQLVRLVLGLAVLPTVVMGFDRIAASHGRADGSADAASDHDVENETTWRHKPAVAALVVLVVSATAGIVGWLTHIPGMTLVFALVAALIMKIGFDLAFVPRWDQEREPRCGGLLHRIAVFSERSFPCAVAYRADRSDRRAVYA